MYPKPNNNKIENIKKNLGYILIEKGQKQRDKKALQSLNNKWNS
jgi:hypothetical protein